MSFVYVDVDDFKKTLAAEGSTFLDDDIEIALQAASAGIDEAQGRTYGKSDEDEVRVFSPDNRELLWIDDLAAEPTTVRVDTAGDGTFETWTQDTDFRLGPLNAEIKGKPFTSIRAKNRGLPVGDFSIVEVTGIFGWPAPPSQIVEATGIIASQLVKRAREAPFGVVSISSETAAYIARNDPHVSFLLQGLGRRQLFASLRLG